MKFLFVRLHRQTIASVESLLQLVGLDWVIR